jgi:hypothetical protein
LLIPLKPNADQMVIPMRITQEMIQTMKGVIGSDPFCELILVKTTIPIMTSAMVSPIGILIDNLISFILVSFVWDGVYKMVRLTYGKSFSARILLNRKYTPQSLKGALQNKKRPEGAFTTYYGQGQA